MTDEKTEWYILCEKIAKEEDPDKLLEIVNELNRILLRREQQLRKLRQTAPPQGEADPSIE